MFGEYKVFTGLLRFDTSALPDGATVTSAVLKLRVMGKADADNRGWWGSGMGRRIGRSMRLIGRLGFVGRRLAGARSDGGAGRAL